MVLLKSVHMSGAACSAGAGLALLQFLLSSASKTPPKKPADEVEERRHGVLGRCASGQDEMGVPFSEEATHWWDSMI